MRKAVVVWNRKAGAQEAQEQALRNAFLKAEIDLDLRAVPGRMLGAEARRAAQSDADVIVAAGGDGTVSAVAAEAARHDRLFGVLPVGTLNHFAKDTGLPLDIEQAAGALASGVEKRLDIAEVNGRVFVNNSSLGLYPRIVRDREEQRLHLGRNKWLALFFATMSVFRRFPLMSIRLSTAQETERITTPLVFIGNNEYEMHLLNLGGRQCLDSGQLSLYVVHSNSRFGVIRLAVMSLLGRLKQERDFSSRCLTEFWLESRRRHLDVAVDGEVVRMQPPLHYRVRPAPCAS